MTVRTRFAPSPTGRLHLGNVRIAVFNWLFTRHHGGAFVLRVEDTDVERNVSGAEELLMEDLTWLGLEWDEGPDVGGAYGPYRQSQRSTAYEGWLHRLLDMGAAYRCFCPEGEAGEDRRYPGTCRSLGPADSEARAAAGESHVLRLRSPDRGEVVIRDEVRGDIAFPANDMDDFVLRRRDGRPTYNFAVVADDVDMAITHVIRGAGHLSNTPKQALIFDALGEARPAFVHLPNVLAPGGGKLSKRSGAAGLDELREAGMLPGAVVNYLSLLGWSHPEEREILTRDELVAAVDLDRVGASEVAYDPEKLQWVAAQHLSRLSLEELTDAVSPFVDRDRFPRAVAILPAALEVLRSRLHTLGEVNDHLGFLFPEDGEGWDALRTELHRDPQSLAVLGAVRRGFQELTAWDRDGIRAAIKSAGRSVGARGPALFHPIRQALTASDSGPDLGGLAAALGRAEVERRLDQALAPPAV